ncbi:MAG: hypothetical protein HC888_02615 [Candidatus Competibacteraceae bacterium]|nr:hypothetical protein [Candidatus Competibacteraceae bacterium]
MKYVPSGWKSKEIYYLIEEVYRWEEWRMVPLVELVAQASFWWGMVEEKKRKGGTI